MGKVKQQLRTFIHRLTNIQLNQGTGNWSVVIRTGDLGDIKRAIEVMTEEVFY